MMKHYKNKRKVEKVKEKQKQTKLQMTLHMAFMNSPGDEPPNFYDPLTHWVESRNALSSEAEPFGCKNQVDIPKIKRQIKSYIAA